MNELLLIVCFFVVGLDDTWSLIECTILSPYSGFPYSGFYDVTFFFFFLPRQKAMLTAAVISYKFISYNKLLLLIS